MPNVTVTTALTLIRPAQAGEDQARVKNNGAVIVEVSKDSGFAFGQGYPLAAGASESFDVDGGEQLYAIAASATAVVSVV